ncbi:MAG: polymer-forming cytoskeletal protein [Candidatus Margulisiibacteriota bacterium]|jgi:cytoskeletal protein CcmA (bactofilin family)
MLNKLQKLQNSAITTVICNDTEIKGIVKSANAIRIEGKIEGDIYCENEVFLGESSRLKGNIFSHEAVIAGEVIGDIETRAGLEITKTGRVYGNITGDRLLIEEGAIYKGKVNMVVIESRNDFEDKSEIRK